MTTASEIHEFVFCERAWWLKKHNYLGQLKPSDAALNSERLEGGIDFHNAYFRDVRLASQQRRFAHSLVWVGVVLLVFAALVVILLLSQTAHAIVQASRTSIPHRVNNSSSVDVPESVMILVLAGTAATLLAYFARRLRRRAQSLESLRNMPGGVVASVDDGNARVLKCHDLQLVGKVDVFRRVGSYFEVEERKSKRLAPGQPPYRSDTLQLAAYCHLVNRNVGPVKRGFLVYCDTKYEIEFNDQLMAELTHTLNKMRALATANAVRRSHNSRARCTRCIAKSMCNERLV